MTIRPKPEPPCPPPTGALVPFLVGAAATLATITVWAWWRLTRQEEYEHDA